MSDCHDCCPWPDMALTDENDAIYPRLCSCICHVSHDDEWGDL